MSRSAPAFLPTRIGDRTFRRIDLEHPEVAARVVQEIESGVPVYYDRQWPMTRRFCEWLAAHPEAVEGRDVLVVGAGVGMEAVLAGTLGRRVRINDMAPVALELQRRQLRANDVEPSSIHEGSFADVPLPPPVDTVLGCFVVYDRASAGAMKTLLRRTGDADVDVLLADRNLGGHFERVLEATDRPVRELHRNETDRVVRVA